MRYLIEHRTELVYDAPVREHHCELRLAPREDAGQRLLALDLETEPPAELDEYIDCFGNRVHYFHVLPPHERLVTRMRAEVECTRTNPFDFDPVPAEREAAWLAEALNAQPRLLDYVLHRSDSTPAPGRVPGLQGRPGRPAGAPLLDAVQQAMDWVGERLDYRPGATDVHAALAEALDEGGGVCQDFAHLLIALVRDWGVPARYCMGYLEGEAGAGEEATHAWAEVLIPNAGWLGFDPTHALLANDRYVAVAVGRDSGDAAPQRGTYKGESAGRSPEISVQVERSDQ